MLFLFTGAFDRLLPGEMNGDVPLSETPSYSEQWVEKRRAGLTSYYPDKKKKGRCQVQPQKVKGLPLY